MTEGHAEPRAARLKEAVRQARIDMAERTGVVVDLHDAEVARLEILNEALDPLFADIPDEVELFERGITRGDPPRLWIDMIAHVVMGRDKRLYRFVQDTRYGRRVLGETADASSFVLEVPPELEQAFAYRAGQFVTHRVRIDGQSYLRSYSMSSSPDVDDEFQVTVKRVAGGVVSNWMIDSLQAGDVIETTCPAGVFCLATDDADVVAFAGGSGITQNLFHKVRSYGVDVVTLGDHIYRKADIIPTLQTSERVVRPGRVRAHQDLLVERFLW